MPLRRTYASESLSLDTPSIFTLNTHDTSAHWQSVPPVPSPTPASALQPALQPKVGKPIVKLPNTSSRFRSSLLGPRQSSLRVHRQYGQYYSRQSSHLDLQIFLHLKRHFKPGLNLYRHVLSREFLRATKKATMDNVEAPTSRHNDDQGLTSIDG